MRTFTKRIVAVFTMLFVASMMYAQMPDAITISPESATSADQLTLTIDLAKACVPTGKNAVAGKVCMHSGYGELSSPKDWKNVVDWDKLGKNGQKTELTDNGNGTWSITFTPDSFYGIAEGVIVSQINAVFNGCDNWASEAKDNDGSGGCTDFFIPIKFKSLKPSIHFKLNMNKMIADGNFDNSSKLYVQVEGLSKELMLDIDANSKLDGIYEVVIEDDKLDDSTKTTFNYEFFFVDLANNQTDETVSQRSVEVSPGKKIVEVWWNDEPQAVTKLQCDMSAQVRYGKFDPANDYVDVAGGFNGWDGKDHKLTAIGNDVYEVEIAIAPGETHEYKFRINGDWGTSEFPGGAPNRKLTGLYKSYAMYHLYDNSDSAKWEVELNCNMNVMIKNGLYVDSMQFIDVAGNFEGWNGGIVLWDFDDDGIYTAKAWVDTAAKDMEFKFRMDGDWNTSEFPGGGPNRKWTPAMNMDSFYKWYNDWDPAVAMAPMAMNVMIKGDLRVGETLTASYKYFDVNDDAEGTSLMGWYKKDSMNATPVPITSSVGSATYTLDAADEGKYIGFVIAPIDANSDMGDSVTVEVGPIVAAGIEISEFKNLKVYPNPTTGIVNINNAENVEFIDVYDILGNKLSSIVNNNQNTIILNTSDYDNGMYFMIFRSEESSFVYRLVKK